MRRETLKPGVLLGLALDYAVRAFNRNPWTRERLQILPRQPVPLYAEDGLWTYHGHTFVEDERFARAYRRAMKAGGRDYTIRWRTHTILWAAERGAGLTGAFVECGTGRGFMASAICEYLDWGERPFYLYDTFLPSALEEDGSQPAAGVANPNYADGPESVAANFAEWQGVQLVVGKIPDTLGDVGPVAFLHIDLNHAVAEESAIRHFWPLLSPGAAVIFDDYGYEGYELQRAAADRIGAELGFRVLMLPTGQGLVLR